MVDKLYIASKNVNLEIMAKLLNVVAKKYDCQVRYNLSENSLKFFGDESYWRHITEELLELIFPNSAMQLVPIGSAEQNRTI